MSSNNVLRINGERLWDSLMRLAQIGATPKGGVCRLALTDLDKQGRDLVSEWAKELGCTISIDQIGNLFFRYPGLDNSLPALMIGSHIDTQPTGGKFDGNYGVLAGFEVVRTLKENVIKLPMPIDIAVWTNEEGSRFIPVLMGSGVFVQEFSLDHALAQKDEAGISVQQALNAIGYAGQDPVGERNVAMYIEAHIEQGPILEEQKKQIGVVTGALGQRWYDVTIIGMEAHAGPTPMPLRKDALLHASRLIEAVNDLALKYAPNARSTVGWIKCFPNSRNVIPGRIDLTVDLRAASDDILTQMHQEFLALIEGLNQGGFEVRATQVTYWAPQAFHPDLVARVRQQTQALGFSHMDIVSGAGHDAVYLAKKIPTAMIFIPCEDGISHNEIENASPDDVTAGANVLLQFVLASAHR